MLLRITPKHPSALWFMVLVAVVFLAMWMICHRPLNETLQSVELYHFSMRQRAILEHRANESRITIVQLGDKTSQNPMMRELFGNFPFDRTVWALLIRFLDRGKPHSLIIDANFKYPLRYYPKGDHAFVESIDTASFPVITTLMASGETSSGTENAQALQDFLKHHAVKVTGQTNQVGHLEVTYLHQPFERLRQSKKARFYTATQAIYDQNGDLRTYTPFNAFYKKSSLDNENPNPLLTDKPGREMVYLPTLGLAPLLETSHTNQIEWLSDPGHLNIGNRIVDFKGERFPVIRWPGNLFFAEKLYPEEKTGRWTVYPTVELWDILRSEMVLTCKEEPEWFFCSQLNRLQEKKPLDPAMFHHRYVVAGTTMTNMDDHRTIYHSNYPGVYIVATILDNVLYNRFVRPAGTLWTALTGLILFISAFWTGQHRPTWFAAIVVSVLAGSYTWLTFVAYDHGNIWLNWVIPTLATGLGFTGGVIVRDTQRLSSNPS